MKNNYAKAIGILVSAGFLLTALTACGSDPKQLTKPEIQALVPSGILTNGVRVVAVQAKRYEYIPNPIVVRAGEQVRLEVTTLDVTHGLAIPSFQINREIQPGKTTIIALSTNASGTYPFRCSVFCGTGHFNMSGELIVQETNK